MNTMKKIALIASFALCMSSFAACGSSDSDDSSSKSSDATNAYDQNDDDEKAATEADTEELTEADTEEPAEDETEATTTHAAAEGTNFTRGTSSGNVYTSQYNGLKITAPEGFTFNSDEEILAAMNLGQSYTNVSEQEQELINLATITDAMAQNSMTGETFMVVYENLDKTCPDPENFTVEDYFEASANADLGSGMEMRNIGEISTVNIAGQDYLYRKHDMYYPSYDLSLPQHCYSRKIDHFIVSLIYSGLAGNEDPSKFINNIESIN
jgi:hypothetical protein